MDGGHKIKTSSSAVAKRPHNDLGGVCLGGFGRTPPETMGDSKTEFNIILCTSKSEAAVTSNRYSMV